MKKYFPIPYNALLAVTSIFVIYKFFADDFALAWLGAGIAIMPMLGFFLYVATGATARTSRHLPLQLTAAVLGVGLTIIDFDPLAFSIAFFIGLVGVCLYNYWYTPLDRTLTKIQVGELIPEFRLSDTNEKTFASRDNNGRQKIWMFIRGNWCPLCVVQVEEMAARYREIETLGTDIFIISSQSEKQSKKLAAKYDVNLNFLIDDRNRVAKTLGIDHVDGVPAGIPGRGEAYDPNTAMPTVVITDKENTVIFASQTDNYRIRPEPDEFIRVLQGV
ncbi:Thiol-disulfide oxidoreductase ResA [Halioglobus japonicus]|nr:Thiol-disulfide oxidoreductase ResA [Halioglobus japonicus]